jgi:hypothetical protein
MGRKTIKEALYEKEKPICVRNIGVSAGIRDGSVRMS